MRRYAIVIGTLAVGCALTLPAWQEPSPLVCPPCDCDPVPTPTPAEAKVIEKQVIVVQPAPTPVATPVPEPSPVGTPDLTREVMQLKRMVEEIRTNVIGPGEPKKEK